MEWPRQQVGPYRLAHLLGRGGMGEVYKAWDERLGRGLAIKRLHRGSEVDPRARKRFRREARALARLAHPAIVRIFDVVEDTDFWIVMELVEGPSLKELTGGFALGADDVLEYGRRIAAGLTAAHEQGIVHRDLKTENVLLGAASSYAVKIVDFGLARWQEGPGGSSPDQLVGTPRIMAPELVIGRGGDARSDLFSLGVLLYELLSGTSPFAADSTLETLHRLVNNDPPPLRSRAPHIPPVLNALVGRLLAKDPQDRPRTAAEVADELTHIAHSCGGEGSGTANLPLALRRWDEPALPNQPYPLLLPYRHPALMAGRDEELARLHRFLSRPVLVLGLCAPSGTGKSSLIVAGLIPALRRAGRPAALARYPHEPGLASRLLGDLLVDAPVLDEHDATGFAAVLAAVGEQAGTVPVLVLDQFEDVLADLAAGRDTPAARPARARAALGALIAATAVRRPGTDEPLCRWVLVYRQEFHGALHRWLHDVLATARGRDVAGIEAWPHDLSGPERFHSMLLRPLAAADGTLNGAARVFQEVIEKPLAAGYDRHFAPGHAARLARAFAAARLARPEAALGPELQAVLALLWRRAGRHGRIELGDDSALLIGEALEEHLRRVLETAVPADRHGAARQRARALLALRELATAEGRCGTGLAAEDLAAVIGADGREILELLGQSWARLVVVRETPRGPRYVLSHDALAAAVVRLTAEERCRGRLVIDTELLALRRLVSVKTAIYHESGSGDMAALRLPARRYRAIAGHADALVRGHGRQAWWMACQVRRHMDRRRRLAWMSVVVLGLALVSWGTSVTTNGSGFGWFQMSRAAGSAPGCICGTASSPTRRNGPTPSGR